MEIAPDDRAHPQRPEKSISHPSHVHRFAARPRLENYVVAAIRLQRTENRVSFFPVQIIRIRKIAQRENLDRFIHAHQPRGIVIRQGLQQRAIDKRENCNGRRHAQRQNQNRGAGESHILPQLPHRKTKILQRRLPPEPKHVPRFLPQFQIVPKFSPCRVPRLLLRHPRVAQFLLLLLAMKFHFFLQLAVESRVPPKNPQLPQNLANRRHPYPHHHFSPTLHQNNVVIPKRSEGSASNAIAVAVWCSGCPILPASGRVGAAAVAVSAAAASRFGFRCHPERGAHFAPTSDLSSIQSSCQPCKNKMLSSRSAARDLLQTPLPLPLPSS